jgi:uncharacterized membrane protein YtjA (UPF0391 family)
LLDIQQGPVAGIERRPNPRLRSWFQRKEGAMFGWAVTFLIVAIVAALLGFGGLAGTAAWMAKVLFIVGLVLFLVFLVVGRRPL